MRQRKRVRTQRSNHVLCSLRSGSGTATVFIKMNFVGEVGRLASIALHKRRVASAQSFLGSPKMPLKLTTWPKHETTASQPFTSSAICSSERSRMLASTTVTLRCSKTAFGKRVRRAHNYTNGETQSQQLFYQSQPSFAGASSHQHGHHSLRININVRRDGIEPATFYSGSRRSIRSMPGRRLLATGWTSRVLPVRRSSDTGTAACDRPRSLRAQN